MPFRIDEIPYFDTKFMCDTSQLSNFTHNEEDAEPWDAPLRRRTNLSSHINSQLNPNMYKGGARRESIYADINEEDSMIVNEIYQRDPNIPITVKKCLILIAKFSKIFF